MKNQIFLLLLLFAAACNTPGGDQPTAKTDEISNTVKLHPENPRYLEYQGKPLILITSAEHYGALLNLDFDFKTYLETLGREGFNYTRIFTGTYIEPVENIFRIQRNTLAPFPGKFISPWGMDEGKYDLDEFNPAYFKRLKEFLHEAEKQGIVVEVTLFTSIYAENAWELSPFNPNNNINMLKDIPFRQVNTLYDDDLNAFQERYIQKMVRELNPFDNFFFEIQNEPWADNNNLAGFVNEEDDKVFNRSWQKKVELANQVSMDWQAWVVSIIKKEEESLPKTHLIAQNICNFQHKLDRLPEDISIVNFHYALPGAVQMNLDLGGVIGLDETGFMPQEDQIYIDQAWKVILSGGGLYNNLDYSFTADHENGTWPIPESNPGWGGPQYRKQLSILVETMKQLPYVDMDFTDSIMEELTPMMKQYGLQKKGEIYLVFVEALKDTDLIPMIPAGQYKVTFIHMESGVTETEVLTLGDGTAIIPPFEKDRAVILIEKIQ